MFNFENVRLRFLRLTKPLILYYRQFKSDLLIAALENYNFNYFKPINFDIICDNLSNNPSTY